MFVASLKWIIVGVISTLGELIRFGIESYLQ